MIDLAGFTSKITSERFATQLCEMLWGDLYAERAGSGIVLVATFCTDPWMSALSHTLSVDVFVEKRYRITQRIPIGVSELERHIDEKVIFSHFFSKLVESLPKRLYEYDPRRGRSHFVGSTHIRDSFPQSPLFDPPGGIGIPWASGDRGQGEFFSLRKKPWTECLLCNHQFLFNERVHWAGGNLLWLCEDCWRSISEPISSSK